LLAKKSDHADAIKLYNATAGIVYSLPIEKRT